MPTEIAAYSAVIASPVGPLGLVEEGECLARLEFLVDTHRLKTAASPLLIEAALQLKHYFQDPKFRLELPLALHGSEHLLRVLGEIAAIPLGQLQTYAGISSKIQSSPRAVGGACGRNPVPLFIPCHRVVAAKGLGGFNAGRNGVDWMPIKRWLLNHEHMQYG